MKKITTDLAQKYIRYMCRKYGAVIIDKKSAQEMQIASRFIGIFSKISADQFMEKYTTTIYNRIYAPFEVEDVNPYSAMVLFTHEIQHVADFCSNPEWMITYLTSRSQRAYIEQRALLTAMELNWWMYGKIPSIKKLAEHIRAYGVRNNDIEMIRKSLLSQSATIKKGKIVSSVGRNGVNWLNKQYAKI